MPAYGNPGGSAPDPYTDATTEEAAPEEAAAPEEETGNEPTAELPKSVLGGKEFKPGEEVVLQVVQVMDNSVLVKYASEEGGEYGESEEAAPAEPPSGGEGGMGSMMY